MGAANAKPLEGPENKAFLNFLKQYKKNHTVESHEDVYRSGENAWGKLTPDQKKLFAVKPREMCQNKRIPSTGPRKKTAQMKKKSVCVTRKPLESIIKKRIVMKHKTGDKTKIPRSKKKCPDMIKPKCRSHRRSDPSPAMSRAFTNYIHEFLKKNAKQTLKKSLQTATKNWVRLSKKEKARYQREKGVSFRMGSTSYFIL
ncbi:hypothetical protein KR009_008415 [Drosophila setifemur]|nr:hypothetical protein KR009_008415 [Drosophila setifemur]